MKNHGAGRERGLHTGLRQAVVEQDSHMVVATHISQATNGRKWSRR